MSAEDAQQPVAAYYEWLALPPEDLLETCRRTPFQASGPGGQKRNRVYSAIRLEHPPSGLRAESGAHREAARNIADALRKLRLALAIEGSRLIPLPPDADNRTAPDSWQPPRGYPAFRAKISVQHKDYPALVFQTLVLFRAVAGELRPVAEYFGVSTSSLARFLKLEKRIQAEANQIRKDAGLSALQ